MNTFEDEDSVSRSSDHSQENKVQEIVQRFKDNHGSNSRVENMYKIMVARTGGSVDDDSVSETHYHGLYDAKNTQIPSVVNSPNKLTKESFKKESSGMSTNDLKKAQHFPVRDFKQEEMLERQTDVHGANGRFNCECTLCLQQMDPRGKSNMGGLDNNSKMSDRVKMGLSILDRDNYYKKYGGFQKDFTWLIENLLPPNERIKGCELIFPDTVFFKNGKPFYIVRMDKNDFCIFKMKTASKLKLSEIYKDFQNVTEERKKDNLGVFQSKYGADINQSMDSDMKFTFHQDDKKVKELMKIEEKRASTKDLKQQKFKQTSFVKRKDQDEHDHDNHDGVPIPEVDELDDDHSHEHKGEEDLDELNNSKVTAAGQQTQEDNFIEDQVTKTEKIADTHHKVNREKVSEARSLYMRDVAIIRYNSNNINQQAQNNNKDFADTFSRPSQ